MRQGSRSAPLSLRARALRYLSQREHSRLELTRKLGPHASSEQELEQVLEALIGEGWLSDSRFTSSLVHRRVARYGMHRIEAELETHGLGLEAHQDLRAELLATEQERAWAAWERRFGDKSPVALDAMRQRRFLMQRGFSSETIRAVLLRAREHHAEQASSEPSTLETNPDSL
jgi:regulatory protein